MRKEYCTQNNGDCKTCSLANYGRDCKNNIRLKGVFSCITDNGFFICGDAARNEVANFPENVVWSGVVENVYGIDRLVRLAIDKANK